MDPEKKSLNFIFPTKYVIPKSLKFSHCPSKFSLLQALDILVNGGEHKKVILSQIATQLPPPETPLAQVEECG